MDNNENLNPISLKERELQLKEKELELRERELRIKELESNQRIERKEKIEGAFNNIKGKISFSSKSHKSSSSGSFFSLNPKDNMKIWSHTGTLSRKGFLFFIIPYTIVALILLMPVQLWMEVCIQSGYDPAGPYFVYLVSAIALGIPGIYATMKRCRDCGISPWWTIVFSIVPFTPLYLFFARTKEVTE